MGESLTYCSKCKKEVKTKWKFARERCVICETPLDKNPIKIGVIFLRDNNQAVVDSMIQDGSITYSDLKSWD